jgi:L-threonylcarbamoyladenylate synthase
MKTEIISPEDLHLALACLKRGEPVAFPTETVYGLGAPLFHEAAVRRIFEIKGRPPDNPLIAHISSLDQAHLLGDALPPSFFLLAQQFWPGPLSLIVKRRPSVPAIVSAGHDTIAIRMPVHPIARRLIDALGEPLVAPSANLSGRPSPTSAQDVWEDLGGRIPFIIDGGACSIGIESTVLSLVSDLPVLLRPGSIRKEALEEVLKETIVLPTRDTPVHAPGMKYRHYAPKAKLRLIFDCKDSQGGHILHEITQQNLYASLRRADRLGVPEIEIFCDLSMQSDAALMNRLLRASGQFV